MGELMRMYCDSTLQHLPVLEDGTNPYSPSKNMVLRELILMSVDKESGALKEEKGTKVFFVCVCVCFFFFFAALLCLSHIRHFFLNSELL